MILQICLSDYEKCIPWKKIKDEWSKFNVSLTIGFKCIFY